MGRWYHCSSRHLRIFLVMMCHNTIKALPIQCHSMSLRKNPGRLNIKDLEWDWVTIIWKNGDRTDKKRRKYVNGKLKTWKKRIRTDFHGQDVPYNIHCNSTAVLKIESVYKQGKNYHPQIYVEECKYPDAENQQCSMLMMMMMDFAMRWDGFCDERLFLAQIQPPV